MIDRLMLAVQIWMLRKHRIPRQELSPRQRMRSVLMILFISRIPASQSDS